LSLQTRDNFHMTIFLTCILILAVLLEGSLTPLPLVLVTLLCLTIVKPDSYAFGAAFIAGIFLDIFALRQIGVSSIFFLTFIFLILLYQRKYEIYSYPFVIVATGIGSALFLSVFGYGNVLLLSGVSVLAAFLLFVCIRLIAQYENSRKQSTLHYKA
jgi:cell shape-determining protein MreD